MTKYIDSPRYLKEKQRRIKAGVYEYLQEIRKRQPKLQFSDEILTAYIRRFKASVAVRMSHEWRWIKEKGVEHNREYTFYKPLKKIMLPIETELVSKKELIDRLTDVQIEKKSTTPEKDAFMKNLSTQANREIGAVRRETKKRLVKKWRWSCSSDGKWSCTLVNQ